MTQDQKAVSSVGLPGSRDGREIRQRLFTFSITTTGRCNAACTYCHYYLARDRKSMARDLSDEQFNVYIKFIDHWRKSVGGYVQYRFSGGDPMVLGKRLFSLADRSYQSLGLKPFMLTAGKSLVPRWAEQARKHAISHIFVSVENPLDPDPGAPDPVKVTQAIKDCHSEEMPVLPGVCVVKNRNFAQLYDTCCWFYERIGTIPLISEVNYDAYQPPTESEWEALETNIARVVKEFHGKTPLKLFPYVSPELSYGGNDPYIFELDLENSYGMNSENYKSKLTDFMQRLDGTNYPSLNCSERECSWWEFCDNTKWFWQGDSQNDSAQKLHDYCRFKRLLNDVYYRALVDPAHHRTEVRIDAGAHARACKANSVRSPQLTIIR